MTDQMLKTSMAEVNAWWKMKEAAVLLKHNIDPSLGFSVRRSYTWKLEDAEEYCKHLSEDATDQLFGYRPKELTRSEWHDLFLLTDLGRFAHREELLIDPEVINALVACLPTYRRNLETDAVAISKKLPTHIVTSYWLERPMTCNHTYTGCWCIDVDGQLDQIYQQIDAFMEQGNFIHGMRCTTAMEVDSCIEIKTCDSCIKECVALLDALGVIKGKVKWLHYDTCMYHYSYDPETKQVTAGH